MVTECDIIFNHPNRVYFGGETLNANVLLRTTKKKSIRGIQIKIEGYSKNRWTESGNANNNGSDNYYYRADEQHLNIIMYVAGQYAGKAFDLNPGTYSYPFFCNLPFDLPSTCQEKYGRTQYFLTVTIVRCMRFDNDFKVDFIVKHSIDLNLNPIYRLPQNVNDIRCCWCCCFGGGEVKCALSIPQSGYVPNQKLPFVFLVSNQSVNINNVKVKLIKVKRFEAHCGGSRKYKYVNQDIAVISFGRVIRYTNKKCKDFFQLPFHLESSQQNKIIETSYYLKGKVSIGGCCNDINVQIPIIIGTIPLIENRRFLENIITEQPTTARPDEAEQSFSSAIMELSDLPTYEDAVNAESINNECGGDIGGGGGGGGGDF